MDTDGGDDGMAGMHIGFEISNAVPAGAAATCIAQPAVSAMAASDEEGQLLDLVSQDDGLAQQDDEECPASIDSVADLLLAVSPPVNTATEAPLRLNNKLDFQHFVSMSTPFTNRCHIRQDLANERIRAIRSATLTNDPA